MQVSAAVTTVNLSWGYYTSIIGDTISGSDTIVRGYYSGPKNKRFNVRTISIYSNGCLVSRKIVKFKKEYALHLFRYDEKKRLISIVGSNSDSKDSSSASFTYYGDSLIVAISKGDSAILTARYVFDSQHEIGEVATYYNGYLIGKSIYERSEGIGFNQLFQVRLDSVKDTRDTVLSRVHWPSQRLIQQISFIDGEASSSITTTYDQYGRTLSSVSCVFVPYNGEEFVMGRFVYEYNVIVDGKFYYYIRTGSSTDSKKKGISAALHCSSAQLRR